MMNINIINVNFFFNEIKIFIKKIYSTKGSTKNSKMKMNEESTNTNLYIDIFIIQILISNFSQLELYLNIKIKYR